MKKILAILLCASMILTGFTSFAAETTSTATTQQTVHKMTFNDVNESTEEGKAIYKLVDAGVVNGNGDGTFTPQNGITRAEFCKMINLVYNYTEKDQVLFTDVKSSDWYYEQVLIAKKAGYIQGYEDGTFRGDNNITRQEFCTIITRINNLAVKGTAPTISDEIESWAVEYVNAVLTNSVSYTAGSSSKNLMSLEEGNTFRATVPIKRGEVAVVLALCYDVVNKTATFGQATIPVTPTTPSIPSTGGSGGGGGGGGGNAIVTRYTITFNSNGGSAVAAASVTENNKVSQPSQPTKSGFTFGGWYTDSACTQAYNFDSAVTKSFTLYAKWIQNTPNTYTVTFNSNGGSAVEAQIVEKNGYASVPDEPTRDGYNFDGWYSDSSLTAEFDFDAVITQNTTVYAKWSQIKTYTVKFVSNGTTFATKKVVEGEAVEYPDDPQPPEDRIYHYFAAWSTMDLQVEVDDFDYDFGEPVYEDITLYARFVADRDSYAADNAEVIEQLIKVRDQLSQNKGEFLALGDAQFEMVVTVADVLTQVIDLDQYQFIITKLNIGAFYPVEVMNVQKLFETLSDEEKSRFADVMSGLDEDTYNFLIDFFEIDIDKYM